MPMFLLRALCTINRKGGKYLNEFMLFPRFPQHIHQTRETINKILTFATHPALQSLILAVGDTFAGSAFPFSRHSVLSVIRTVDLGQSENGGLFLDILLTGTEKKN